MSIKHEPTIQRYEQIGQEILAAIANLRDFTDSLPEATNPLRRHVFEGIGRDKRRELESRRISSLSNHCWTLHCTKHPVSVRIKMPNSKHRAFHHKFLLKWNSGRQSNIAAETASGLRFVAAQRVQVSLASTRIANIASSKETQNFSSYT